MYSVDLKKMCCGLKVSGNTIQKTRKTFKTCVTTVKTWVKQFQENGGFSEKYNISNRKFLKIDPEKFLETLKIIPTLSKERSQQIFRAKKLQSEN